MRPRTVQRLMVMALLAGCLVVCAGQTSPKYHGWVWLWLVVNVVVGLVFVGQEIRERRR